MDLAIGHEEPKDTPGSPENTFNNNTAGVIPVAILSDEGFDATQVDPASVLFQGLAVKAAGKTGRFLTVIRDVNGDGLIDLEVKIEDTDHVFEEDDSEATLTGETHDGTDIEGSDMIRIVP
jgi:hypothetical protein